jgi:phosphoribosylformimino-5-aminoimidazole carboxamide ribotide isomerase
VRSREVIEMYLDAGVDRVVIGSAALKDWPWFVSLLKDSALDSGRLALGLDAREGKVAAEGWTQQLETCAADLAGQVSGSGLGAIVYTDIARDGMLAGVNIDATGRIVEATDVDVIASGGVAGIEDVSRCLEIGCAGVIVGKAMYEGKIDLSEAIEVARVGSPTE